MIAGERPSERAAGGPDITRRQAIGAGIAAAGALAFGRRLAAAEPYGPFKMGIQSYSLRGYTKDGKPDLDKALKVTKNLGLSYWESNVPTSRRPQNGRRIQEAGRQSRRESDRLRRHALRQGPRRQPQDLRVRLRMGVGYVSADPDPGSFDSLDKFVAEYGVAIGIHNHGPGHRYAKIDTIAAAIKDQAGHRRHRRADAPEHRGVVADGARQRVVCVQRQDRSRHAGPSGFGRRRRSSPDAQRPSRSDRIAGVDVVAVRSALGGGDVAD